MVISPWQVLYALHLCRQILYTGCQSVVHIREQIIALVPTDVGYVYGQPAGHGGMAYITAAFLHLSQFAVSSGFQIGFLCRDDKVA